MAAPVPLPPQPTTATLMVSSAPEKKFALDNSGAVINPPAIKLLLMTKSLLDALL